MRLPARAVRAVAPAAVALLLAACGGAVSPLAERLAPSTAHERYAESLRDADLAGTALGAAWLAAADSALADPVVVTLPFRAAGYLAADEARAVGYQARLRAGERLVAHVEPEGQPAPILFADLFVLGDDSLATPERVESADSTLAPLEVTADRDATYVLRVQGELLRAGRYVITMRVEPSLAFPVEGRDSRAVRSFFGAERDGGRRDHHGIDIFAPRGTPAVAATEGVVRSVTPNTLGGRVVWLSDPAAGRSLYYAHLDTVLVAAGQRVEPGDTLGLVGNTGNARTTPPHLHFGIYRRGRGPVDPLPFVRERRTPPPEVRVEVAAFGQARRARAGARLAAGPGDAGGDALPAGTTLRVLGAAGTRYHVRLPDGRTGWLPATRTEPLDAPLRRTELASGRVLRDRPLAAATVVDSLAEPATLPVLGRFGDYALVRTASGRQAWALEGAAR